MVGNVKSGVNAMTMVDEGQLRVICYCSRSKEGM